MCETETSQIRARLRGRKDTEIREKLASLERELDQWGSESAKGQLLEKHAYQIARTRKMLGSMIESVRARMSVDDTDAFLALAPDLEEDILELHRIWGFFRRRLALRFVPWFYKHLEAADELCWILYRRVIDRALEVGSLKPNAVKEPPLVYFNDVSTPITNPRNRRALLDRVHGLSRALTFPDALAELPVPIIGIPWFQLRHLPEALMLAHEVGHCVEEDLGPPDAWTRPFEDAMEAAKIPEKRRAAWRAWRSEIAADAFGVLALGPAFARALADFLIKGVEAVRTETRTEEDWGAYPTAALRILLAAEVLKQQGYKAEAEQLSREWAAHCATHTLHEFEADVEAIASALRIGPWSLLQKHMHEVLFFGQADQDRAQVIAKQLLLPVFPQVDGSVPSLFVAARLAFESNAPELSKRSDLILDAVLRQRSPGLRSRLPEMKPEERHALDERDARAGADLAERLREARKKRP